MPEDFLVARNPDGDSKLPYLLRIPLGEQGVILKARDTWPRTAKVYCHRVESWPGEVEVIERVPTRSCVRRGASIELVLDRALRESFPAGDHHHPGRIRAEVVAAYRAASGDR